MLFQYFTPAQDRRGWRDEGGGGEERGEGRERGWVTSLFFSFSSQLAIVCIYQSQVLLVRWTPSAVDTEYRLHEIVVKLNFKRTNLSV